MVDGEGKIICPKCGRIWHLTKHKLIQRDKDTCECRCGHMLHSWNQAAMFTQELIKGLPEDTAA